MASRPTGELVVLFLAATVCGVVLFSTIGILVIEIVNPDSDTSKASVVIGGVLNTLLGLIAGYLAGRTGSRQRDP
jgi:hypothetical protein